MSLPTLYPAQVGSPYSTLAAPYTSGESTMTLVDATKLPAAPNIVCLAGDVAGEFSYTGKEGNVLQGVVALPGTPVATTWSVGAFAFRGVAAYDLNSLRECATRGPIAVTVDDLTGPIYIAHRGGANLFPENTMYAFEGAAALGCQIIETDVYPLADGTLVCSHDGSLTRMSSSSGNISDHTTMDLRSLVVDCSSWFNPQFPDTQYVFFEDVLRRFGGRIVICVEAKTTAAMQPLTDLIVRYGLEGSCIVASFTLNDLVIPIAAGIPAMAVGDSLNPTTLATMGVEFAAMSSSASEAYHASMIAAGMKTVVYTVNRHYDRDLWLAWGVSGFFSDDPLYLEGIHPRLSTAPYLTGTYYHGHIPDTDSRGTFVDGRWGYPSAGVNGDGSVTTRGTLMGWACPIEWDSYTLTATITYDMVEDLSRWAGFGVCCSTDRVFLENDAGEHGYLVILRGSGVLSLYRAAVKIGEVDTGAPILTGGTATLRIAVTPTNITVTRTDVPDILLSVDDATYRGPYAHHIVGVEIANGGEGVGATFSNVSVTPIV